MRDVKKKGNQATSPVLTQYSGGGLIVVEYLLYQLLPQEMYTSFEILLEGGEIYG